MTDLNLSAKGLALIDLYKKMAQEGYTRSDGEVVKVAFSDFELRFYRNEIKPAFEHVGISSLLDYGAGGSDWVAKGFDESGLSATEFFGLSKVSLYDPARAIDERIMSDCVVCFDVLEHIHILDVRKIVIDLFCHAEKLLIINVACYSAAAQLPNGENAHITVRHPLWWKGLIDSVSVEFPNVAVWLMCSTGWRETHHFAVWRADDWAAQEEFVIKDGFY